MEQALVWAGIIGFCYLVVRISKWQNQQANKGVENVICPHCQTKGQVTAQAITKGQGISGGKATGALLTGGASMLLTGLSRNEQMRRLHCGNCNTKWDVA